MPLPTALFTPYNMSDLFSGELDGGSGLIVNMSIEVKCIRSLYKRTLYA